jgi:hypothetical protein
MEEMKLICHQNSVLVRYAKTEQVKANWRFLQGAYHGLQQLLVTAWVVCLY